MVGQHDRGLASPHLLEIRDYIRPRAGSDPLRPRAGSEPLSDKACTNERLSDEPIYLVDVGDCEGALGEFRLWLKSRSTEVYSSDSSHQGASDQRGERSTSESGAHGHMNPLSWDNISSPIQTTIMNPTVSSTPLDTSTTSNDKNEKKRRSRHITQPKGTLEYTVSDRDSMASVAAHFDITCSEIKKLNKLMSTMIYPGQTLYLPDKDYVASPSPPSSPVHDMKPQMSPTHSRTDLPVIKMSEKPKGPGHAERLPSDPPAHQAAVKKLSVEEAKHLDAECMERFIKISVKHITDGQGVVNGVLLVTPNAVMFDPNVSDPLVVERGPDMYGMIAPMETIISAAIYTDIAAMKVKTSPKKKKVPTVKPTVYHADDCPFSQNEPISDEKDDDVFSRTRNDSVCSCNLDTKTDNKTDNLDPLEESTETGSSADCPSSSAATGGASCSTKSEPQVPHPEGAAAAADEGLSYSHVSSSSLLLPASIAASDGSDKCTPGGGDDKHPDNEHDQGIFRRTLGSLSSIGSFAGSQIVDFSSGLFTRGQDDKGRVKDVTEVDGVTTHDAMDTDEKKKHVENVVKLRDRPELFKSLDELIPRP